jgi:TonB family protein
MRCGLAVAALALCAQSFVLAQDAGARLRPIAARTAPVYPELARSLNLQGVVKLRVAVTADGIAKATEVLGGNPVLARAAQDAVAHWKWAPSPHETTELVELRFHPK